MFHTPVLTLAVTLKVFRSQPYRPSIEVSILKKERHLVLTRSKFSWAKSTKSIQVEKTSRHKRCSCTSCSFPVSTLYSRSNKPIVRYWVKEVEEETFFSFFFTSSTFSVILVQKLTSQIEWSCFSGVSTCPGDDSFCHLVCFFTLFFWFYFCWFNWSAGSNVTIPSRSRRVQTNIPFHSVN